MSIFDRIRAAAQQGDSLVIKVPKPAPTRQSALNPNASAIKRDSAGHFIRGGPSPNPKGGRSGALAKQFWDETNGLTEIKAIALSIARGELTVTQMTATGELVEIGPTIKDRMEMIKWITDRTAGKAADIIKIEHEDSSGSAMRIDPARVRPEHLLQLLDVAGQVLDYQQSQVVEGEVLPALAAQAGNTPSESEE
jgi:hypothetical protein